MIELENVHVDYLVQRHGMRSIKAYFTSFGSKRLLERKRILHGVDLQINGGECFGIIGRNGSGKSTLASRCWPGSWNQRKGACADHGHVAPMLALGVGLEPEIERLGERATLPNADGTCTGRRSIVCRSYVRSPSPVYRRTTWRCR